MAKPAPRAPKRLPPQHQTRQPGRQTKMRPRPRGEAERYRAAGKLTGKIALITGGDSGIGRAAAIAFAKEGADIAIAYLNEHKDARRTEALVAATGRECLRIATDVGDPAAARKLVAQVVKRFGRLDILVNNAAEQHPKETIGAITPAQLQRTFRTNIFSMFYVTRAALGRMKRGAVIINTASVTAYRGSAHLLDYAATKGAIVAFTRSLALSLADRGIRVNGVAPGPIWTPLIPSSFSRKQTAKFGRKTPLGRPGQPDEVAPSFVFLASEDASYMTGQMLHPNGGEIVNA